MNHDSDQSPTEPVSGPTDQNGPDTHQPTQNATDGKQAKKSRNYLSRLPRHVPDDELPRLHGRPSIYTEEIAQYLIDGLSRGQSLSALCRPDGMPAVPTVLRWAQEDREGFSERYTSARALGYQAMADQLQDIADDAEGDIDNKMAVQRDRLRVDTRKWLLAKMIPSTYGDNSQVEHKHVQQAQTLDLSALSAEEAQTLLALMEKAQQAQQAEDGGRADRLEQPTQRRSVENRAE